MELCHNLYIFFVIMEGFCARACWFFQMFQSVMSSSHWRSFRLSLGVGIRKPGLAEKGWNPLSGFIVLPTETSWSFVPERGGNGAWGWQMDQLTDCIRFLWGLDRAQSKGEASNSQVAPRSFPPSLKQVLGTCKRFKPQNQAKCSEN